MIGLRSGSSGEESLFRGTRTARAVGAAAGRASAARVARQQQYQLRLASRAGFLEYEFQLGARGLIADAERLRGFLQRQTRCEPNREAGFRGRETKRRL